jgi:hypothetical protein
MWNSGDDERERKREEERKYRADVTYEVWRSGRNPDRVDYDRVSEHMWQGDSASQAASHEIRFQRQAEERKREERALEEEQMRQEEARLEEEQRIRAEEERRMEEESQTGDKPDTTPDTKETPF